MVVGVDKAQIKWKIQQEQQCEQFLGLWSSAADNKSVFSDEGLVSIVHFNCQV